MQDPATILRSIGSKVTPARVHILEVLASESKPLTASELQVKLDGDVDPVTLYRNLDLLTEAGIIERTHTHEGTAHYEFMADRPHHHHLICTNCGQVEDVEECHTADKEQVVLKLSKKFNSIRTHKLEFLGTCNDCISR